MMPDLKLVRIVLVEPKGAFNIGSVARVMMNMGFSELALVNPAPFLNDEGYKGAVAAKSILKRAVCSSSVRDAVRGSSLVVGSTRRAGKRRRVSCSAEQLSGRIFPALGRGRVSILFGREESGLTNEETDLCNMLVRIPSHPSYPSLNLSHAVGIVCYRLFVDAGGGEVSYAGSPATHEDVEELIEYIRYIFGEIGFFSKGPPDYVVPLFRKIFGRALLEGEELENLTHIFHRLYGLFHERKKRDRADS